MKLFFTTLVSTLALLNTAVAESVSLNQSQIIRQESQVLAEGKFVRQGLLHRIRGNMNIAKDQSTLSLNFSSDFKVTAGPDLRVVLRSSKDLSKMIVVSSLKSSTGAQSYVLPISEDMLAGFDQVVVYCLKYHVDFGIAEFQAR